MRILATMGCAVSALTQGAAQQVTVHMTSQAGSRMERLPDTAFQAPAESKGPADGSFKIDEKISHQRMIGFGASFLEAGMISLNCLPEYERTRVMRALFDVETGAGFSAMKTVIAATDFMSAGPFYTYNDNAGDVQMTKFSIERDLQPNGLIPYIELAKAHGNFVLQATMDFPPNWMLVDGDPRKTVDPRHYGALALYYKRYLEEYAKKGIKIDYLSPFNEPKVYTQITYPEIRDIIRDHLGPLLHKSGLPTRLQISEHNNPAATLKDYGIILEDPEAAKYIACLAYHSYGWQNNPIRPSKALGYAADDGLSSIRELRKRYRHLPLWMTETCYYNDHTVWARPLPRYEYADGDFWGNQIFDHVEAGAAGWTYWNMILDQNGGPWLLSPAHNNHENNRQQPVVIIDRDTKEITFTGLYYYLAHFSKFVRPYSIRIETTGSADGIRCLAFIASDKKFVCLVMNSRDTDTRVEVRWDDKVLDVSAPAQSISTYTWKPEVQTR